MHKRNDNKPNNPQKGKSQRKTGGHKRDFTFKKSSSKSTLTRLSDDHKDDLGAEYSLNDIIEIGYPIHDVTIDIVSSGKPDSILQEIHLLLCEMINVGLDTKESLAQFLGLSANDFILDELFLLLENGIIDISENNKYRVTSNKGETFIKEKKFIPVTTQEGFRFYIDGLAGDFNHIAPSKSLAGTNRLNSIIKIDFEFVQNNWWEITKCYSKSQANSKEIVDLASYKRSIVSKRVQYDRLYVLVYSPREKSGKKIQLRVYNSDMQYQKRKTEILNFEFGKNKYLFDFSNELAAAEEYKQQFLNVTTEIVYEKLSGKYQDISTFEHKQLIKDALLTSELAVYIESPWIRKATMDYIAEMDYFLSKKNTKLFISYGIDGSSRNRPHKETFEEIERLAEKHKGRLFLFNLPSHFSQKFPNRTGSHRKLLIKDYDYYVKGSFNWLSYSGNETENYAVEEGTQFFNNVKEFWTSVFSEYQFDRALLNF